MDINFDNIDFQPLVIAFEEFFERIKVLVEKIAEEFIKFFERNGLLKQKTQCKKIKIKMYLRKILDIPRKVFRYITHRRNK